MARKKKRSYKTTIPKGKCRRVRRRGRTVCMCRSRTGVTAFSAKAKCKPRR